MGFDWTSIKDKLGRYLFVADNPGVVTLSGSNLLQTPSDTITRPNDTTAYAVNDVVSTTAGEILEFSTGLSVGGSGIIMGSRMKVAVSAVPAGMSAFRLHLYNAAPTAIADNAAFNLPAADLGKYLGYITISTPIDLGDNIVSQDDNINFTFDLAASDTKLYGILQTGGAFTPSASTVKTVLLNIAAM